jgi:hypothetical protein
MLKSMRLQILATIFVLVGASLLSGCSSYFKRKECEATNWFQYGESLAMQGRRTTGDQFIFDCKRAEANISEADLDRGFKKGMSTYCTPQQAFRVGKEGDLFSQELCDGPGIREMMANHSKGLQEYCAPTNGQRAGASGKKYQGVCPKDLEVDFLKEYSKGRRTFLTGLVQRHSNQLRELETEASSAEREKRQAELALSFLPEYKRRERVVTYDSVTRTNREEYREIEDETLKRRHETLRSSIRGAESRMDDARNKRRELQATIDSLLSEIQSLN